jgi:hypothetical protein
MSAPGGEVVRRWVDAYTRGLPPEARAARREEIDDDLWCQLEESMALGRSARSLRVEVLLRLLLGLPADISWRLSQAGVRTAKWERSTSMSTRMVGALWVVAGVALVSAAIVVAVLPESSPSAPGAIVLAVGSVGALAFLGAVLGLVWQFRGRLGRLSALAGGVAALGMLLVVIGAPPSWVLLPLGSAVLVWDLARAQAIPRALAIVFGASSILLLVSLVGALFGIIDTADTPLQVALALPYLLSWIALGVSLLRGMPIAQAPLTSA